MSHELLSPFSGSENNKSIDYISPTEFTSLLKTSSVNGGREKRSVDSSANEHFYHDQKGCGDIWIAPDRKIIEWKVDNRCIRKFRFDNEVIKANFVDFASCENCLVIILQDVAHVYYISKGDSTTVCFPFPICNAFWYSQGIILERKMQIGSEFSVSTETDMQHRFITLSDPMAPFGYIEFSNKEKGNLNSRNLRNLSMLVFPRSEEFNITVLFDNVDLTLHFYYTQIISNMQNNDGEATIQESERKKDMYSENLSTMNNASKVSNLRKISILNRRAASVNIGHEPNEIGMLPPTSKKIQENQLLPKSQLHNNGTRRSISATLDRMSGTTPISASSPNIEFSFNQAQQNLPTSQSQIQGQQLDQHHFDSINQIISTKGDVLLTRISSMTLPHHVPNDPKIELKCIPLRFQDREAITIFDKKTNFSKIWLIDIIPEVMNSISFKVYGNSPPNLIRLSNIDISETIYDVFSYHSQELPGTLAILCDSPERKICLYNPFIELASSKHVIDSDICFISGDRMVKDKFEAIIEDYEDMNNEPPNIPSIFPLPKTELVKHCFEGMKWICHPKIFFAIVFLWQLIMADTAHRREFDDKGSEFLALKNVFTYLMMSSSREDSQLEKIFVSQAFRFLDQLDFNSYIPKIIMGLHLIREELALNVICKEEVENLGNFLSLATTRMNWPLSWREYYGPQESDISNIEPLVGVFAHPLDDPPSIIKSLLSITENSYIPVTPFISFSRLVEMSSHIDQIVTPQSYKMLRLYEMIRSPSYMDDYLLEVLTDLSIRKEDIELYPIGIITPLNNMLQKIEDKLAQAGSNVNLSVIKRYDLERCKLLVKQLTSDTESFSENNSIAAKFLCDRPKTDTERKPRDIYTLLSEVITSSRHFALEKGLLTDNLQDMDDFDEGATLKFNAALIFSEDRRFNDVLSLLIYYKPHKVQFFPVANEYRRVLKYKKNIARILSIRTCLSGLGFGAVAYSTEKPLATQKWQKPSLNFTYYFSDGTKISMDSKELNKEILKWGEFHGGVSSGLRISRKAKGINGSWIAFNKPKILDAQHGGFLLGLGFNGHLKGLEEWHVYNYLSPKITHVSIGLLLGMSASMKGTMDLKLTKVLSVHIVALLPPGSSDLNIDLRVQTAGIVGIGLLYQMSQHRRMSELLFSQLKSFIFVNDEPICDESYRLAAGISLGLINLGAGKSLSKIPSGMNTEDMFNEGEISDEIVINKTDPDRRIIEGLLHILTETQDVEQDWIPENSQISAAVALILIFLRTRNISIASTIKPNLRTVITNFLPHIFMYRELAFHMIMWDTIQNDLEFLLGDLGEQIKPNIDTDNLPIYYIIAGRALSMGLKYASTGNLDIRDTIIQLIDKFLPFYQYPGNDKLDFKLTINGINNLVNVLIITVSLIMCGTGDLQTFRRIRYLHEVVLGKHSELYRSNGSSKKPTSKKEEELVDGEIPINIEIVNENDERIIQEEGDDQGNDEGIVETRQAAGANPPDTSNFEIGEDSESEDGSDSFTSLNNERYDDENHYAKFMASSMALGFLFFGSGQHALKTSDNESLAYLIISTLPTYMSTIPLQETKYFWSMALEPRCLMFRNAKTEEPINGVPFILKACFNENILEEKQLKAPCLLPDIKKIRSLKVNNPNFYPLEINFESELKAVDFFKGGSIIYIQPKEVNEIHNTNIQMNENEVGHKYAISNIQQALKVKAEKIWSTNKLGTNTHINRGSQLIGELNLNDMSKLELENITANREIFKNEIETYGLDMLCLDANSGDTSDFQLEIWRKRHGM